MNKGVYCIIGSPCAGKGTQCELLSHHVKCISAGNILRSNYALGTKEREALDQGHLVNTGVTANLINKMIEKYNFNIILDGYPRNKEQAENLLSFLSQNGYKLGGLIILNAPKEILQDRTLSRHYCKLCQKTFKIPIICCDIETTKRLDDNLEILNQRLKIWDKHLPEIKEIMKDIPQYNINTEQEEENIFFYIKSIIGIK